MKKGQINNMFTMLMTLLIIATLAIVAARFTDRLLQDKCTADLLIQQKTITNTITTSNDYGAVANERFSAACKQVEMCFVDARSIGEKGFHAKDSHRLLKESVIAGAQTNIFSFTSDGTMEEVGYVSQLALPADYQFRPFCVNNKAGFFSIQLRGQASTTLVTSST